jgi:hypothetical protein
MLVGPRSLDNFGRLILRCAAYDRRFFELARQIVNCDAMGKRTLADFLEFNMSMVFSLMQEFADAASPGTPRPGNPAEWLIAIRPHLLKLLREQPEMPRFYESVCKEILEGLPPLVFGELDWACDGLVDYIRGVRIHQVTFNATSEDPATRMAKLTAIEPSIRLPGSEKRWQGLKTLGEFEPTPFLIENLLVEGTVSMIFGPPGDGKTFLALDIGSSIASGRPWNGLRTERGGVLYFCLEAGAGFRNRMRALKSKSLLADDDPFGFTTEKLDLRSPDTQVRILNDIKANEAVFKTKVKLIVIDTLAVATSGGNECTSEDMGAALAAVGEVVKSSGVTVLLLHHPGKDVSRGPRGWSGIVGNLDTIIEMERCSNGLRRAKVTKQKDGEEGQTFTFELAVVTLRGKDQQSGTTCVVRHLTDEEAQAADGVDDPENLIRRLWAGRSHDEIITTATVREVLAMKQKGGSASTRATETMEALAKGGYVKETSRGPHNARQWLLTANGKELFHQASRPDTGSGES